MTKLNDIFMPESLDLKSKRKRDITSSPSQLILSCFDIYFRIIITLIFVKMFIAINIKKNNTNSISQQNLSSLIQQINKNQTRTSDCRKTQRVLNRVSFFFLTQTLFPVRILIDRNISTLERSGCSVKQRKFNFYNEPK